jgi:hypothetical protein
MAVLVCETNHGWKSGQKSRRQNVASPLTAACIIPAPSRPQKPL